MKQEERMAVQIAVIEEKVKNIEAKVNSIEKILYTIIATVGLAVLGAVLKLILIP